MAGTDGDHLGRSSRPNPLAGHAATAIALTHLGTAGVAWGLAAYRRKCEPPGTFEYLFQQLFASWLATAPRRCDVPGTFEYLFQQLFVTGVVLHSLIGGLALLGLLRMDGRRRVLATVLFFTAVGVLLTADYSRNAVVSRAKPVSGSSGAVSWAQMTHDLLAERREVVLLALLTITGAVAGGYAVARSMFTIEYASGVSGLQVRMPGQRVYYIPVYPQQTWQRTGIAIAKGERLEIDVYGWVSPGALQGLQQLANHMKRYTDWQVSGSRGPAPKLDTYAVWPYTPPCGYKKDWYEGRTKLMVFRQHQLYQQDRFYERDEGLTVRGLPHNIVLGTIRADDEDDPRSATEDGPGYVWGPETMKEIFSLSRERERYPVHIEAPKSGTLWVVINDVDACRWDNGGLFFMKVIIAA